MVTLSTDTHAVDIAKVLGNHTQHVDTHTHHHRQWHLLSRPVNKQLGRPLQHCQFMQQQLIHHKLAN